MDRKAVSRSARSLRDGPGTTPRKVPVDSRPSRPDESTESPESHRIDAKQLVEKAGAVTRRLQRIEFLRRLQSARILDRAMLFAALLLLLMFPFLIVASASMGRDFGTVLSHRMGLNSEASHIVGGLFARGASSAAGSSASWSILLVVGALAIAGALQRLYEDVYGLRPMTGVRVLVRRLIWVCSFVAVLVAGGLIGRFAHDRVIAAVAWFGLLFGFFWWTLHWLLNDRLSWQKLVPSAVFTSAFAIGLGIFSSFYFSKSIISNFNSYGSIGAVLGLMSWLVAVAVVLILGSIVGLFWQTSGWSVSKAVRAFLRPSRRAKTRRA